jgi:hypothetical protein
MCMMKWEVCRRKRSGIFKELSQRLSGGTKENREQIRTVGLRDEIQAREFSIHISGSHGDEYEDGCHLGCCAVYCDRY